MKPNTALALKRKLILNALNQNIAEKYPSHLNIRFGVSNHFIDRLSERHDGNFDRAFFEVIEAIETNICLIIYFIHLDCVLPDRGRIRHDDFEIRGNVIDGRYVLTTFIGKD